MRRHSAKVGWVGSHAPRMHSSLSFTVHALSQRLYLITLPLPLADYLAVLARHGPRLWELRSHKRWVRERFRSWRAYQRSELGFWRRVCHGLPQDGTRGMESVTTVAYGDANIGQPGRGGGGSSRSMRGPCEAVFGKRRVVGVDEFLTSQRCHVCTEQLHTVVDMRPGHWLRHATQPTLSSPSRRPRKGDVVWGLKCVLLASGCTLCAGVLWCTYRVRAAPCAPLAITRRPTHTPHPPLRRCCTSSSCSRRFHDRDTTAALNIVSGRGEHATAWRLETWQRCGSSHAHPRPQLCAFLARHRREERPPYLTSVAEGWTKGRAGVSVVLSEPEGSVLGALSKGGHLYRPGVP